MYFSERELGKRKQNIEEIDYIVYNAIYSILIKYERNMSINYPLYCPDDNMAIIGTNKRRLEDSIIGQTRLIEIGRVEEYEIIDTYKILDLLEFYYSNMKGVGNLDYHSYFGHYHLSEDVEETKEVQNNFRNEINRLFEINGMAFEMEGNGIVKRKLPVMLENIINNINFQTSDETLNKLVILAVDYIKKPNIIDRKLAVEKLWDAFERMKTYYSKTRKQKGQSAQKLINEVSENLQGFDIILDTEFKALTSIGNDYQIRHFETDKIEITSFKQIDYLFYRMISLINLCVEKL